MPRRRSGSVNLAQFSPLPLFLGLGFLLALISLATSQSFAAFFKAFAFSMIIAVIAYSIIVAAKKASVMSVLGLVVVTTMMFLGATLTPQYLPLQTVPMALISTPYVSDSSVAIPDAVVVLVVALLLGLILKLSPHGIGRSTIAVVLATAVTFFASATIIGALLFGQAGEWLILVTPFTGIQYIGVLVAFGYIALAYLLWIGSRLGWRLYFGVQILAVVYAVFLGQWLSTVFSLLLLAALFLEESRFQRSAPKLPL